MMHSNGQAFLWDQTNVTIRAFRSLTQDQIDQIVHGLTAGGSVWAIDRHLDYDGYHSILVTHERTGATFLVSGFSDRIELAELQDDVLRQLGCFSHPDEVIAKLLGMMA